MGSLLSVDPCMMLTMSDTPSPEDRLTQDDEIKTARITSGYLLEGRIAQVLQGRIRDRRMCLLLTSALLLSAVAGYAQWPTPSTPDDQSGGRLYRVGGGVTAPTLLDKVEPEYSEEARTAKLQGTMLLYVQVDPSGKAVNMRVLRSLGLGLDEKAIEAVKKWRFKPGVKDGKPVTVEAQIEVNFQLPETAKAETSTPGPTVVTWKPGMDHVYQDGYFWFRAISPGGAIAVVSVSDNGQYMLAQMAIANRSNRNLDILPERFVMTLLRPKKKMLEHIPPERVIGKINSSVAWSRLFAGMAAATATHRETTISETTGTVNVYGEGGMATGTYSGTINSTRQAPDEQQRQQIWEAQREREQQAYNRAQSVANSAVRANTLGPGREIHGLVYFKRERSCASRAGCSILLTVPVGYTTFEFPVYFGSR